VVGRPEFSQSELLQLQLNLKHGRAFAVASNVPALIEGVHAEAVLYIFDESKSISDATFDAAEGAFSGPGEAFGLCASTPGEPVGRFYDIQQQKPGLKDWFPIHVNLSRAVAAGRVDPAWAEQCKLLWGPDSALYANRVLGEFHDSDEDGVIKVSWVEAAMKRWEANKDPLGHLDCVGVDVARSGADRTVMALRYGDRIQELRDRHHEDTTRTADRASAILKAHPRARATVDDIGVGAGVTDRLRHLGHTVIAFCASERTDWRDHSKELRFANTRAAAWWNLRERLDPALDGNIELPPIEELVTDLCAPHWQEVSGRILIESKDDIRKRIHRSTDRADAVVQAFWVPRTRRRARMHDIRLEEQKRRDEL
jgi:hypothetical protein